VTAIRLHAPMAGWAAPLDEVPDPVFAERMMGEGLAIDPLEGVVRAPCDAEVISIPDTAHAVTLRLANGAELLIHVGLETVGLRGEGFTAHVAAGRKVRLGDELISFDLDGIARKAKSLVSPIVVTSEGFAVRLLATDKAVAAGDPIAELSGETLSSAEPLISGEVAAVELVIRSPHGIHARPAAKIAAAARGFAAVLELSAGAAGANARSPVALMALGLKSGDRVRLTARGADAQLALAAVAPVVEAIHDAPAEPGPTAETAPRPASRADARGRLHGIVAAPGFAVGPALRLARAAIDIDEQGQGVESERAALASARAAVGRQVAASAPASGGIASAHLALLDDPELLAAAESGIAAGRSAGFAWRAAIAASADALQATGDALLIERIDDLRDLEWQVLAELAGEAAMQPADIGDGAILVADNLLVSQVMALDLARVGGICTARGGPTSHVAILAASAGVPMLVAAGDPVLAIGDGDTLILDADDGWIDPAPEAEALAAAADRAKQARERRAAEAAAAAEDCRMADGTRIEIFANLASADEARRAVAAGAEGCGLLRTEFLFHGRASAPSEEEQRTAYAEVAEALGGRPLIIRTLDAGGDKPLPYLALPPEDNPALGLRGVRLGLARPELLAAQLRAILRAASAGDVRVMVPMIVDVGELRSVRFLLDEAAAATGAGPVPLGVMIETPAAALLAASLAAEADFLSVGTNDLSQYALAADRGNPATAARIDALHPAVLRLIAAVGEGARSNGKWFGICGGVASDPLAAAILIGLGASELSAAPAAIPALKAAVRRLRMDACRNLATRVLEADGVEAVRSLAAAAFETAAPGGAAPAREGAA
jgi:phosphocarrier protein FPr/phosphocarrier protein